MAELNFYRGLKSKYSEEEHRDGIYFATDKHEIILNGSSYGLEIDDELLSNSTNPATSRAIYKAIQEIVKDTVEKTAIGSKLVLVKQGNTYKVELYDSRTNTLLSQTNGFIGGEGTSDMSGLSVQWLHGDLYIRSGQTANVRFKFDVLNSSGYSTGTPGHATLQIVNSGNGTVIKTIEKDLEAGQISVTDITEYLIDGSSITINILVSANTSKGEQTEQYSCRAFKVSLKLVDEGSNIAVATKKGDIIKIPYVVEGSNVSKTVKCYLNGSLFDESTKSNSSFEIPTTSLTHGSHSIQIRAEYKVDEITTIYSNTIYYDRIVYEEGNVRPVIATRFEFEDGSLITGIPYINIEQYDSYELPYAVYDPSNVIAEAEFYSDNELIGVNNILFQRDTFSYRYNQSGNKFCSIKCGLTSYDYRIDVVDSSLNIEEPTSGLQLYLDAYGKSNNSNSKNSWSYKDITTTFENITFGGDGWQGGALRLMNGGKATINYQPLKSQTSGSNNAFTFSIKFKVTNVIDENEVIVDCRDELGTGFVITTQEAKFITNGGRTVATKFAAGEVYNLGFVSYPVATETSGNDTKINTSMIYLYINGILSASEQRDTVDNIYQTTPQNITLKAEYCTLDIYSIRSYNTQLTDEQMFACYLIDLGDSVAFKSEYSDNDILDFNNNISVASIYGKIPYIIVTGKQLDGQATLPYVAVVNDKDPKYDVDSILYVDGAHPEFNFMCVPGEKDGKVKKPQIRLQGTSSLAYPRKNYRLYTKDAALYVGCDAEGNGGTLAKKSKYSMSANAAPVNCFCIKADYAESSSSHNTGMANMVHDVMVKAGDLTPAQKYVNKEVYKYDVRTTVEGHPCLLFYRANESDTPIFAGKFNFNNDKSTEEVFGFLDIDGYHKDSEFEEKMAVLAASSLIFPEDFTEVSITDDDEVLTYTKETLISEILSGNPTECWEFKNNNNRMGVFKEADFDKKIIDEESGDEMYAWLQMWEARFPDEDALNAAFELGVKPTYLMRCAQWIHSTDTETATGSKLFREVTYNSVTYTHDTAEYRAARFKAQLKDYFDVKFLCDYYILNDCVAGVDQRVKNMMWGFWYDPTYSGDGDGILCYPIYYDNDTILGVRNDGRNVFHWDIDEESLDPTADPSTKSYAFAGHDSVLWKNLREQFSKELGEAYQRIRKDNMTNARMYYFFDDTQSGKFCERIYNKDAQYKYIIPKTQGVEVKQDNITSTKTYNYTFSCQGDRKAHRHWFINNRMDLFDAKYNTGSYTSSFIQIKGPNKVSIGGVQEFKATAARNYYFHVRSDEAGETHRQVSKGETWTYTYDRDMSEGSTFYFTGCNWMSKLDLSNWKGALALDIPNMPVLEELIIGNTNSSNQGLTSSPISNNMPLIKKISVINYKSIPSFDFSNCSYLEEVDMTGCDNATIAQFAKGGNISKVAFPKNYQKLILQSLPKITVKGLKFESLTSIRSLNVDNCPHINGMALLETIFNTEGNNLKYVRITGLDITGSGEDLIKYYESNLGGVTNDGNDTPNKCYLIGKYRLTTLLENSKYQALCEHFPELIIEQPKYTTCVFHNKERTPEKISNYDNHTGYEFMNDYIPSGHIKQILDQRHSYLVKKVSDSNPDYAGPGTFAACRLSASNSYLYYDGESQASLNGREGDLCFYEPHYWYKGVNDHTSGKLYAFYSTSSEVPTIAQGVKVQVSDLTLKRNTAVNATDLYNTIDTALISDAGYNSYKYTLPEGHNYARVRVTGVASNKFGAVACNNEGRILKRCLGGNSTTNGMFTGSYLWFDIPSGTSYIWFTMSSDNTYNTCDYALYITPSLDIEDLEPDWVEHKEAFIGRILSTPDEQGESISAFVKNGEYSSIGSTMNISDLCKTISERGAGYHPFDYEAYKEIFMLGYLSYGTTYLQGIVGQGRQSDGTYKWNTVNLYFPNPSVNYAKEGEKDTSCMTVTSVVDGVNVTYPYVSIYSSASGVDNKFPAISTMMGYHQFIANGGTISQADFVDRTRLVMKTRLRDKVKLFSISGSSSSNSSYKYANFIQGGRYLDIVGVGENDTTYNSENTGYCLSEIMESSSSSTAGYLICGYQGYSGRTKAAGCLRISESTGTTMSIGPSDFDKVLRVMIIPNTLIVCDDFNDYKNYLN